MARRGGGAAWRWRSEFAFRQCGSLPPVRSLAPAHGRSLFKGPLCRRREKYKYEAQKVREARVPYPFYPAFGSAYLFLARCLVAQAPVAATSLVRDTRVEGLSVPGAYPSLHSLSQSIKPGEARPSTRQRMAVRASPGGVTGGRRQSQKDVNLTDFEFP